MCERCWANILKCFQKWVWITICDKQNVKRQKFWLLLTLTIFEVLFKALLWLNVGCDTFASPTSILLMSLSSFNRSSIFCTRSFSPITLSFRILNDSIICRIVCSTFLSQSVLTKLPLSPWLGSSLRSLSCNRWICVNFLFRSNLYASTSRSVCRLSNFNERWLFCTFFYSICYWTDFTQKLSKYCWKFFGERQIHFF